MWKKIELFLYSLIYEELSMDKLKIFFYPLSLWAMAKYIFVDLEFLL